MFRLVLDGMAGAYASALAVNLACDIELESFKWWSLVLHRERVTQNPAADLPGDTRLLIRLRHGTEVHMVFANPFRWCEAKVVRNEVMSCIDCVLHDVLHKIISCMPSALTITSASIS